MRTFFTTVHNLEPGVHLRDTLRLSLAATGHKPLLVLLGGWLFVNVALLWDGVRYGSDSTFYLDAAQRLQDGAPLVGKQASYLLYDAIIAAAAAHGGVGLLVTLQLAASAGAMWLVYAYLKRHNVRLLALAVFAVTVAWNPDVQRWNSFVLTDSFYTSALTVFAVMLARAIRVGGRNWLACAVIASLAAALRPTGWLLPPLALVAFIAARWPARLLPAAAALYVVLIAALPLVPVLRHAVEAESPAQMLVQGVTIWGYPPARIDMPSTSLAASSIGAGFAYVRHHPFASFKLAVARIAIEAGHVRPYYSVRHNTAIILILGLLYGVVAWRLVRRRWRREGVWILAIVAAHALLVAVMFADWDGRFLIHVLPLLGLFALLPARTETA